MGEQARAIAEALFGISKKYPRVNTQGWDVGYGNSNDGRQLEYYPPNEAMNPHKGRPSIEIFNKGLQGDALQNAIFGDMLHHQPTIDPQFAALKQQFQSSFNPQQTEINKARYQQAIQSGETGSFDDWMNRSQVDAYIRGYLAPDAADEWRKQGAYTPEQMKILDSMKALLGQQ